jgi:hypothetical protein
MLVILERIAKKLGAIADDDPTLRVLKQATEPERLIEQIDQAKAENSSKLTRRM